MQQLEEERDREKKEHKDRLDALETRERSLNARSKQVDERMDKATETQARAEKKLAFWVGEEAKLAQLRADIAAADAQLQGKKEAVAARVRGRLNRRAQHVACM